MVREIPLTRGLVALVDDEDFEALNQYRWHAGRNSAANSYAMRWAVIDGRETHIRMHREVLQIAGHHSVDHIDGNGLNNTRINLRVATQAENNCNVRIRKDNRSGFKGVSWISERGCWKSAVRHEDKTLFIGHFDCPELAGRAYDEHARLLHGQFARLNFPLPGERSAR